MSRRSSFCSAPGRKAHLAELPHVELISIPVVPWATGHMVGAYEEALETQRLHHLYKHVSNPAELQAMS